MSRTGSSLTIVNGIHRLPRPCLAFLFWLLSTPFRRPASVWGDWRFLRLLLCLSAVRFESSRILPKSEKHSQRGEIVKIDLTKTTIHNKEPSSVDYLPTDGNQGMFVHLVNRPLQMSLLEFVLQTPARLYCTVSRDLHVDPLRVVMVWLL